MGEGTSVFRMFDVVDGDIVRRQTAFGEGSGEGERREDLYMACVLEPTPCKTRGPQAKAGVRHAYWTKPECEKRDNSRSANDTPPRSVRAVFIPTAIIEAAGAAGSRSASSIPHKGVRPAITFTLDELVSAAREMGELTGQTHLAGVLETARKRGLFKRFEGATVSAAGCVTIERAINMVGIVGSGKSVFANVLTYACAKRGLRVATVHNSISDVIESFELFESLGVEASPLISKNRRLDHLDELASKMAKCCWTTPWPAISRRPACWMAWPNTRTAPPVMAIAPALASKTHGATDAPAPSSTYAPRNPWPARRSARAWSSPHPRDLR